MRTSPIRLSLPALVLAALLLGPAPARAQSPDTVLLSNSYATVTRGDFDAELLRLPADTREGFANDARRVSDLLNRLLVQKSLAAQARNAKLDQRPDNAARLALERDKLLAAIEIDAIDAAAAAEFDANAARYEARARELYLIDKAQFANPPQVSATHILFDTKKHTSDEARKLAVEARAKILAGADMGELAKQVSDDPSSSQNMGALGWFSEKEMDPAFGAAAFALAKPGDLSEPVQSQFGWHIIRLDGKRPATTKTYEEARASILAELKRRQVMEKRDDAIAAIRRDPKTQMNQEAVTALTPKFDLDVVRRAQEAATKAAPPAPK
jgi:peptidyl-prolyl cis-trans isomerase C